MTGKLSDTWAMKDNRIKVVHQGNMGCGNARNRGLKISKGEFVMFVDPDDYVDPNFVSCTLSSAQKTNADVVFFNHDDFWESDTTNAKQIYKGMSAAVQNNRSLLQLYPSLYSMSYVNPPWNKLYKKRILQDNNVLFPEDVSTGEDNVFSYILLKYINSASILPDVLYHYRHHQSSKTSSTKFKQVETRVEVYRRIARIMTEIEPEYLSYAGSMLIGDLLPYIVNLPRRESVGDSLRESDRLIGNKAIVGAAKVVHLKSSGIKIFITAKIIIFNQSILLLGLAYLAVFGHFLKRDKSV